WFDRAFVASSWQEIFSQRGRYYAGLTATWGILAWLMLSNPADYGPAGVLKVEGVSKMQYAVSQPGVILHYLRLVFWPYPLCLDYGWPIAVDPGHIATASLAVGALVGLTAWSAWRWPKLGFLGGSFFLILAPTSSIAPLRDLAFEHRMYLPLAAVLTLVAFGGLAVFQWMWDAGEAGKPLPNALGLAALSVVAVVVVGLGSMTYARNKDYESEVSIWRDAATKRPRNARAFNNLGSALIASGQPDAAIESLDEAVRLDG